MRAESSFSPHSDAVLERMEKSARIAYPESDLIKVVRVLFPVNLKKMCVYSLVNEDTLHTKLVTPDL